MFFSPLPTEPIRLSALGRDVSVGNLYDYFTNGFVTSSVPVLSQFVHIEEKLSSGTECCFMFQHQPIKLKRYALGINSQVEKSMEQGFLDWDRLWFAHYLKSCQTEGEEARVDVYIRVVRRVETFDSRFYESNKKKYQETSGGRTHLVEQVVYGAEFVFSMRKVVDRSCETKESVEGSIYLAAKTYFAQALNSSTSIQVPADLDRVSCTTYSSMDVDNVVESSFRLSSQFLRDAINKDDRKWRPVEILLRYIPEQLETRLWSDRLADHQLEKEQTDGIWKWIVDQSRDMSTHPSVDRIPPLAKAMAQFRDGLTPLRKAIKNFSKSNTPEQAKTSISNLMSEVAEWLIHRRREMESVLLLLKDSQLPMFDLENIQTWEPSNEQNRTKVFVLKVGSIPDPLMEKIKILTNNSAPAAKLPVFSVLSGGKERFGLIRRKLRKFAEEEQSHHLSSNPDTGFYIGLVPVSSPLDDATITTIEYHEEECIGDSPKKYKTVISHQELVPIDDERPRSGSFGFDHQRAYREVESQQPSGRGDVIAHAEEGSLDAEAEQISISSITNRVVKLRKILDVRRESLDENENTASDLTKLSLNNQRIAEIFASDGHSQLVKKGQPNVFLLNAKEQYDGDFRWFDIGWPDDTYAHRKHKVIVLMGSTGCGKSTLIDGMVNYILGVQWKDPFRFKCVREDESTSRNQTYSQTRSVTAYTIHYHKGMAVPYSITIIDTPGYGDTRGVARDKEITKKIQDFLAQQAIRVDQIHSACFVAASGDSRLTTTQRYILDSVLTIFGSSFKENIQLLVTFADNTEPPVVEACRAGNFLMSCSFPYSKFNNSVLYASNQQGNEDFGFDELFWDMCQVNYFSFFMVLEEMKGCNLTPTGVVTHSAQLPKTRSKLQLVESD